MKFYLTILILLLSIITKGQNPSDSLLVVFKSDQLIEIVKPLIPEIHKTLKTDLLIDVNDKSTHIYPKLKNGDVKIYNRFYQLIERYKFQDSSLTLVEFFQNERKVKQTIFVLNDSISTFYFTNGNISAQEKLNQFKRTFLEWYENGNLKSMCEQVGDEQKCDNWDSEGYYTNGSLRLFKNRELISEFELDRLGRQIKKIK